jgi:LysR family carnitine catabolism transcriptional activator
MDFTSRQLRAFLLVAEHRSFSRAAQAMYLTPSGISVLIRELETQLGFRLFDRTTRHVTPTAQGEAWAPVVRRTIDELRTATATLSAHESERNQSITVGAAPLVAANLLPQAIKSFRAHRPAVRIRVFDANLTNVMEAVQSGTIEMAIGVFPATSGIRRVRLFRFSFLLIRPAETAAPRGSTTWSAAATADTLIVLPASSPVQHVINQHLAQAKARPGTTVTVNALDTQIAMVEAGEGVAIIPAFGLPVCRNRNVAMTRLVNPVVTMDFHEIRSRGKKLPEAADDFAAFLHSHVSRWAGRAGVL